MFFLALSKIPRIVVKLNPVSTFEVRAVSESAQTTTQTEGHREYTLTNGPLAQERRDRERVAAVGAAEYRIGQTHKFSFHFCGFCHEQATDFTLDCVILLISNLECCGN